MEICSLCGSSVAPGSGKFVNRIPDFNTVGARVDHGRPYPLGEYVCKDCDDARTKELLYSQLEDLFRRDNDELFSITVNDIVAVIAERLLQEDFCYDDFKEEELKKLFEAAMVSLRNNRVLEDIERAVDFEMEEMDV